MEIIKVLEILSLANISLQLATAPDDVVVVVLVIGIDSEASNAVLHPGDRNRKKYLLRGPLLRVHTYIYAYVGTCIRGASIACISARTREAHHGSRQSNDNDRNRLRAVKIRRATRNRRGVCLMRRPARKATQSASFSASTGTGRILRHRLGVETIFSFGMRAQKSVAKTGKDYGLRENLP